MSTSGLLGVHMQYDKIKPHETAPLKGNWHRKYVSNKYLGDAIGLQ
jgi:hypothetical protein